MYLKLNGEIDGDRDNARTGIGREPTWHNEIAYTFDRTNKQALDRPTVTIAIPVKNARDFRFHTRRG